MIPVYCGGSCLANNNEHVPFDSAPLTCILRQISPRNTTITCLDVSNMILPSLDGIELPSSITCLRICVLNLDAARLPPALKRLEVSGRDLTITNKFPDSLAQLTVCNSTINGLDHFMQNSGLKKLVLMYVEFGVGFNVVHLPRRLEYLNINTCCSWSTTTIVDFPPALQYLNIFNSFPNCKKIACPQMLTFLRVSYTTWMHNESCSFPVLESLEVYGAAQREFNAIPPSVRTFRCDAARMRIDRLPPNLVFTDIRRFLDSSGQQVAGPSATHKVFCCRGRMALPGWNQFLVHKLILRKESDIVAECSCCRNTSTYRESVRTMIRDRFSVVFENWVHDMLDVQVTLILMLIGQRRRALPVELVRMLSLFLLPQ
jgi:hypothetical protein